MKILGVDPSMSNFGLVTAELNADTLEYRITQMSLVETKADSKNKQVRKSSIDLDRARELYFGLHSAMKGVSLVFCEMPIGSQSARAMASYGICMGIIASVQDAPLIQVTPNEVKMATVGSKTATKQEMIDWAYSNHPYANWSMKAGRVILKMEHLADAVGSIEAGLKSDQFKQASAFFKFMKAG